ncbi:protein dead ringer-like isoform X2 [Linepithema humile]|uniref:protein dead ringer-like isoform X2 n=1 Tax=Linepithema humile TaxID=83485 RepID=UPI0006231DC0|nr:PREDICTED: protein dead ringer-like isoform X2 [Linepithema humile]
MDPGRDPDQDRDNPGGGMANGDNEMNGVNGANGTNGQYRSPESFHENDESDSGGEDVPDEGEELPNPPSQSPLDPATAASLAQLTGYMNPVAFHLPKFKLSENGDVELPGRNGLEALQNAMSSGHMPFNIFPPSMYMPPLSQQISQIVDHHSPVAPNIGSVSENQMVMPSSSKSQPNDSPGRHNGESSQGSSRNNGEPPQGNPRNNGEPPPELSRNVMPGNNQHQAGTNWSYEDQFKQLYELDNNPRRKDFLDQLFSFMQQRGTPINRLPIMAKSVLDLFELYNLVVARGGLVEVINKKLWQEIIKGLRLPASITSAAFTLRTQYMKYLYPYESKMEALSTQDQLMQAIETNRRESRRTNNYGNYPAENMVQRSINTSLTSNSLSALPPVPITLQQMAAVAAASGSQHHGPLMANGNSHVPHIPPPIPQNLANVPDYILKVLNREVSRNVVNNSMVHQQNNTSTPSPTTPDGPMSSLEITRFTNLLYHPKNRYYADMNPSLSPPAAQSPLVPSNSPEPQREALDLANASQRGPDMVGSPTVGSGTPPLASRGVKRDHEEFSPCSFKRGHYSDDTSQSPAEKNSSMRITQVISVAEDGKKQLEVSMRIDGILYEGILPAKDDDSNNSTQSSPNNKASRNSAT